MFEPTFCPYPGCPNHRHPEARFFLRHGSYRPRCRNHPVPRFRCRACRRTFSRQTFRADFRDRRPHLNRRVLDFIASGVGLRQTARRLGISRSTLDLKVRKIARTCVAADRNLQTWARRRSLAAGASPAPWLQMDELLTYESCRTSRPVAIANVIESRTRFFIASEVAAIRPNGRMTAKAIRQIERDEARFGPRPDESPAACRRAFRRACALFPGARTVHITTDERSAYRGAIHDVFRPGAVQHRAHPGSAPRGAGTLLFPINQTEAIARDHVGRLRRRSWLVSKERRWLQVFIDLQRALRNWTRARFNGESRSPAELLGLAPRILSEADLGAWRQDWGQLSPSPFGDGAQSHVTYGFAR